MHPPDVLLVFTRPLDDAGMVYMVTGSVASMIYGEPRFTADADIVLDLSGVSAGAFVRLFPADVYYCPPDEAIVVEMGRARRGHFNIIHHESGMKADVYLRGEDPLHDWGLSRRRHIAVGEDASAWIAPPEYVILRKLEYYREGRSEKHRRDIQGVLRVSGDGLDVAAIEGWAERLGVSQEWRSVREGERGC